MDSPPTDPKPEPSNADLPDPPRALLLDPNRGARTRSEGALREAGLQVTACSGPVEAIEVLQTRPDLAVVILTVNDQARPEVLAHALETLPPPRPALLALFPRGIDAVEMESEAERLGALGALARPVPGRALGITAWALARMVLAQREALASNRSVASARARQDPLDPRTQLYRFEHFKPLLAAELKRARRYGLPFTLLRIAFDAMAEVELLHGPELTETLEGGLRLSVTRALRDQDIAVDLGPGQLLAVLPHTGRKGARVVAERIRRRVAKTRLTLVEGSAGTTASVGLAVYPGQGEVSFSQMVREASDALKIAQINGGDRAAEVPRTRRARRGSG